MLLHTICLEGWKNHWYVSLWFESRSSDLLKLEFLSLWQCVKGKCSCYRPGVAQRVGRDIALLFHDRGTRRGEWSATCPGRTLPPGKTRYPLYRRLGGPQGQSGRTENHVPTGIWSRTVQPVASRSADWATWPTLWQYVFYKHVRATYSLVLSCMALCNGEMYGRICGGNMSYCCCKTFMWCSVLLGSISSKSWCESKMLFGALSWWVNVFSFSSRNYIR